MPECTTREADALAASAVVDESRDRFRGAPIAFFRSADGSMIPAPFLMSVAELAAFLRLGESVRFPAKTIARYRSLGLRAVRVGRRVWFRLDDVLRFLDAQQARTPAERAG